MHDERDWGKPIVHLLNRSWQHLKGAATEVLRFRAAPATAPEAAHGGDAGGDVAEPPQTADPSSETPGVPGDDDSRTDGQGVATNGYVVIQSGQVHIMNPVGGGLLPVLIPGNDVILTIDGMEVTKPVSVWAGQSVRVSPRSSAQPVRRFQIRVPPDGMAAWLTFEAQGPPGYQILDAGPAHVVPLVVKTLPGSQANPTLADIEQALTAAGVVAGLDHMAILRALDTPGRIEVKAAAGQPVQPSRPGRIERAVWDPAAADPLALAARVHPGQSLALVIPPLAGQSGYDVMGRALEPAPVQELRVVAGPGTRLTRDGAEAVAAVSGRPWVLELEPGVVQAVVIPVTELPGPLTPGPLPYQSDGDAVILGDVCEGVTIYAAGWIWVRGMVQGAILQAGQGVRVDGPVHRSRLITRPARSGLATVRANLNSDQNGPS